LLLLTCRRLYVLFFFCNAPATTVIYTLSLHDALPISVNTFPDITKSFNLAYTAYYKPATGLILLREYILEPEIFDQAFRGYIHRSEEHTSELQSRENLVCRLLLEKKNKKTRTTTSKTE